MGIRDLLDNNPIIAAVKDEDGLNDALKSNAEIIFILFGDLLSIKMLSEKINNANKIGVLHADLIEGLSNKEIAIKYIKNETSFHGIISTKPQLIKCAKNYDLLAIQRVFVFDNISLKNSKSHIVKECDAVEVLPGVIPKVIEKISDFSHKPIVAGGLIESKEEVILALNAGATCVSTSNKVIWDI